MPGALYLPVDSLLREEIVNPKISAFFFFNDTATTEIYTLSLHDALPISISQGGLDHSTYRLIALGLSESQVALLDRKSTRLNSSHSQISYAVFCLKKKRLMIIKKTGCW